MMDRIRNAVGVLPELKAGGLLRVTAQPVPNSSVADPRTLDADLCLALRVRLTANHYRTVSASDGYSALALALRELPDLVLLDLGLPGVHGFVVLKFLREFSRLADTPVIILTGRNLQAYYKRALESGAVAYM